MKTTLSARIVLIVIALGFSASLGFSCRDQGPDASSVPSEVQESLTMQRWYMFYLSATESKPSPAKTPKDNYISAFDAPGQDEFVATEYKRLLAAFLGTKASKSTQPSVSSGSCNSDIIALVQTQPASLTKPVNICVSTFLIHAVFVKSSGPELLIVHDRIQSWGLNPRTFDGSFDAVIAYRERLTPADWNAVLGTGGFYWNNFASSIDFVLARQIVRSAGQSATSTQTEQSSDIAAKQLLLKADGNFDITSLISALEESAAGFGMSAWGYETQGDFAVVDGAFRSL
jgi:hypothetical protein